VGKPSSVKNLPEIGQFVFHGHREFCNGLTGEGHCEWQLYATILDTFRFLMPPKKSFSHKDGTMND